MYIAPEIEFTFLFSDDILTSSSDDNNIGGVDGKPGDNTTEDDEL